MSDPILTIELVPKSSFYSNVRSEVTRSQWDKIRKQVYDNAGHKCEICGGVGKRHAVEAHEIWNYNDVDNIQTLVGMIALCPSCHQVKHIGLAQIQGKFHYALGHLAKINSWTLQHSNAYVERCFEEWNRRSQKKWKLDISYLDKFLK